MSAPAMASLLTGEYPYRLGLRHNGGGELGTLSSSFETVAERALRLKYRTMFVSGAPPLLRRTGLHQGFEVFDDAIHPTSRRLHRPAREVVDIFTRWVRADDRESPFFAVLHLGDLQVPWQPMPDDSGRIRESSVRGQLEEIDESLSRLWAFLKAEKLWEQTTIVVVGLQGDSEDLRLGEIPALDLHSDTTHIGLLIRERARHLGRQANTSGQPAYEWVPKPWAFDVNVSLADVGMSLVDWLEGGAAGQDISTVPPDEARSLRSAIQEQGDAMERWRRQERLIVTESGWAKWRLDAEYPIRVALRRGPYLYIHDRTPTIYNTLTDAFEVSPMPRRNSRTLELRDEFSEIAGSLGFREFPRVTDDQILEDSWARSYFSRRLGSPVFTVSEVDQRRIEKLAETSMAVQTWRALQRWESGSRVEPNHCSRLVFGSNQLSSTMEAELARACPFRGAREVARWYRTRNEEERDKLFEAIFRADQQRIAAVRVAEASLALGRIWESGSTRMRGLEGLEILLAQPQAARLRQQITRRSRTQPEL
jgi:hypothetical protein